jgi:hypothetical protein
MIRKLPARWHLGKLRASIFLFIYKRWSRRLAFSALSRKQDSFSFINMCFFFFLQASSQGGVGYGIKREIFFLNLEDGYFGCQVNESTTVLQLFELSHLCDGTPNCFMGSDELSKELKCTSEYQKTLLFPCMSFSRNSRSAKTPNGRKLALIGCITGAHAHEL